MAAKRDETAENPTDPLYPSGFALAAIASQTLANLKLMRQRKTYNEEEVAAFKLVEKKVGELIGRF